MTTLATRPPIELRLFGSREGDNIVIRCCTIHQGDVQFFTVAINIPQLVRQLEALGLNSTTVSGFGGWLKKAVRSVGRNKIMKGIAKAVTLPAKVMVKTITAPVRLAAAVVRGDRIDKAVLKSFKEQLQSVKDIAPYVQTVISFVPAVGTGISAGLGAGLALASGKPITEALLAGVKSALPGGPLAAAAFDVASAAVRGKPLLDVALNAIPLQGQQKQLLVAGLKAAADIARGKRVDQALMNQADAAMALLPADAQKALKVGVALAKGQVLQAAGAVASGAIPGQALNSALKHVSPQALGAVNLASQTLGRIKLGNATTRAARGALKLVKQGNAVASLMKTPAARGAMDLAAKRAQVANLLGKKGSPSGAAPILARAVQARGLVQKNYPVLAKRVADGKAVKAQLSKLATAARAGNADARFTAAAIARTAKMKENIAVVAQKQAGGTPGLVIDSRGQIRRSPRGRWIRASSLGNNRELLYTGPQSTPLPGTYNAVSGLPKLPKIQEDIKAVRAAARGAEMAGLYEVASRLYIEAARLEVELTKINGNPEPYGCPLTALGILDQDAKDADVGSRPVPGSEFTLVSGGAWGDSGSDPEGYQGPLYPVRYDDPAAWPHEVNAAHVRYPVSGWPIVMGSNTATADRELRARQAARARAKAAMQLAAVRHHLERIKLRNAKVGNMSELYSPEIVGSRHFKRGLTPSQKLALQKKIDRALRSDRVQSSQRYLNRLRDAGNLARSRVSGDSDLPPELVEQSDGIGVELIGCGVEGDTPVAGFPAYLFTRNGLRSDVVRRRFAAAIKKMPPKMRRRVMTRLRAAVAQARVSGHIRSITPSVGSHWPTIGSHYQTSPFVGSHYQTSPFVGSHRVAGALTP